MEDLDHLVVDLEEVDLAEELMVVWVDLEEDSVDPAVTAVQCTDKNNYYIVVIIAVQFSNYSSTKRYLINPQINKFLFINFGEAIEHHYRSGTERNINIYLKEFKHTTFTANFRQLQSINLAILSRWYTAYKL